MKKPRGAVLPIASRSLRELVAWFNRGRRILPWREEPTLYRVWISEIMLQQTQVVTVLPYFDRFLARFPRVEDLARADEASVMKLWEGLGYYSRARNLHRASKVIVAAGGSERGFPKTRDGWLEIPGVGPYTAGAITSIALGHPEPIVDGNVERVYARLRRLKGKGEAPYKAKLWELSRSAVVRVHKAKLSPSDLNQAWMELGATVCTPKNPRCEICPIRRDCDAHAGEVVAEYPAKKKRAAWVDIAETRIALVEPREKRVYLEPIPVGEWRAGTWDFPKMPKGKTPGQSLGDIETKHVVTHHRIERRLRVFRSKAKAPARHGAGRWVSMTNPEVALGSAPREGILRILERLD